MPTLSLGNPLQSNTNVTHLDLSDNGLGIEGTIAITAMLKENCYITHLVIHYIQFPDCTCVVVGK